VARCSTCGYEGIRWSHRENGTNHPPLEPLGTVLVFTADDVVRPAAAYRRHICDPDDMEQWRAIAEERRAEAEAARQAREQVRAAYDEERAAYLARVEVAMRSVCPKCGVAPQQSCINLSDVRRGRTARKNRNPHIERLPPVVVSSLPSVEDGASL
jgi:predicted  nucleic acid-binding Zn-ribbon protein